MYSLRFHFPAYCPTVVRFYIEAVPGARREQGRLVFREGALVTAVREGHWVLLDELNLAPSEVLEALNRRGPGPRTHAVSGVRGAIAVAVPGKHRPPTKRLLTGRGPVLPEGAGGTFMRAE